MAQLFMMCLGSRCPIQPILELMVGLGRILIVAKNSKMIPGDQIEPAMDTD
jgi:hypothetical protein